MRNIHGSLDVISPSHVQRDGSPDLNPQYKRALVPFTKTRDPYNGRLGTSLSLGSFGTRVLIPGDRPRLGDGNCPPLAVVSLEALVSASVFQMKGAVVTALTMAGSVSAFFAPMAKTLGGTQVSGGEVRRGVGKVG